MNEDPGPKEEHPLDPREAPTFLQFLGAILLIPLIYAGAAGLVELARRNGVSFSEHGYGFSVLGLWFVALIVMVLGSHWLGRLSGRDADAVEREAPETGEPGIFQCGLIWVGDVLVGRPWVGMIVVMVLVVVIPKFFRDGTNAPLDPADYFQDTLISFAKAFGSPIALLVAAFFLAGLVLKAKRAARRGGPS